MLGSLINFRINEALIGPDANGVTRDQFVTTWGAIYRSILDGPVRALLRARAGRLSARGRAEETIQTAMNGHTRGSRPLPPPGHARVGSAWGDELSDVG